MTETGINLTSSRNFKKYLKLDLISIMRWCRKFNILTPRKVAMCVVLLLI